MLGVAAGSGTPISRDASVNFSQMLSTAVDAQFGNLDIVSYMFATSMIGPTKGVLEHQAARRLSRMLRGQLVSRCLGYLEREEVTAKPDPIRD